MPAPDYSALELHYGTGYGQINVQHAYRFAGGRGDNVKLISVDSSLLSFQHEDLPPIPVVVGSETSDSGSGHAQTTLGPIVARHNGYGINGIAPNVYAWFARTNSHTLNAAHITAATALLNAGDFLMLQRQRPGPAFDAAAGPIVGQFGWIPVEWWPEEFAAIKAATDKGVIVVAVAGNGAQNLDDPIYNTPLSGFPADWENPFNRALADSGSILVGAASPGKPRTTDWGPVGSRMDYSNYGACLDASSWGREVATLGVISGGVLGHHYFFNPIGTSYSLPLVVGALISLQGALKAAGRPLLTPASARAALRATGFAQTPATDMPASQRIGSMVDLKGLYDHFSFALPVVTPPPTPRVVSGMSVAQLMEKVYQHVGRNLFEDARILECLNEGQEEISRLTTAPTMEVIQKGVTGPFKPRITLRDGTVVDVDYNGILEVYASRGAGEGLPYGGYRVDLRTTSDASRYFPNWRENMRFGTGASNATWESGRPIQYLIYDPVNLTAELTPLPRPVQATDLYIKLHVRPTPMTERTHVPLNGEFASYHEAVWRYAVFLLVNEMAGEDAVTRGTFHYNRFKQLADRMISAARPEPAFITKDNAQFSDY